MTQVVDKCSVCGSERAARSHVIREYEYYLCDSCGLLYLKGEENAAKQAEGQYDSDYFKDSLKESMSGYMDYAQQSRPLRMKFKNILSRIDPYMSPLAGRSMLDVGCAYGFFLDEAKKLGMFVHGSDVSKNAVQWMEKHLGINGTVGFPCDAPAGPFDLITAVEVIEHTPDPGAFLDELSGRLRKGGLLVVVTAASDTPLPKMLANRWWYLNPPDHCSIFSRTALKKLILQKEFELLEHSLIAFNWVGLNNILLKMARMLESDLLGKIASKMPALVVPVVHYCAQIVIARKK